MITRSPTSQSQNQSQPSPALYVSTSLKTFETTIDEVYQPVEIIIDEVVLKRLDARYFAYLARNLEKAKKAYQDDKLPAAALAFALARFARVEKWAVEHIGEERIKAAIDERKRGGVSRPLFPQHPDSFRGNHEPNPHHRIPDICPPRPKAGGDSAIGFRNHLSIKSISSATRPWP